LIRVFIETIELLPLLRTSRSGMSVWTQFEARTVAKKTVMTFPGESLPSLTSFEPNQNPATNIALMTKAARPREKPQALAIQMLTFLPCSMSALKTSVSFC
jgi:hypothetical protein